jgi:hypothetical protein
LRYIAGVIGERPRDQQAGAEVLGKIIARHNRHVVFLAASTLFAAAIGWAVIYGGLYWLTLLVLTIGRGLDARPPHAFTATFLSCAAATCIGIWFVRRGRPEPRPRDTKSPVELAAEVLLAVPRMTLAFGGTLSAYQHLNRHELELGWNLLSRLKTTRSLPLHSVPLELPQAEVRGRILDALQLAGLIEFQQRSGEPVLVLCGGENASFRSSRVRIRAPRR